MERSCEPMEKNRIEGVAKQGERARNRRARWRGRPRAHASETPVPRAAPGQRVEPEARPARKPRWA